MSAASDDSQVGEAIAKDDGDDPDPAEANVGEEDDSDVEDAKVRALYCETRPRDVSFLQSYFRTTAGVKRTESGLLYRPLKSLTDDGVVCPGSCTPCSVHYRGILTDGTEIMSTYRIARPALLKPSQEVDGLTEALQLMKEGEEWEIVVPSHLGYGLKGRGDIPPGAALIYQVELVKVNPRLEELQANVFDNKFRLIMGIICVGLVLFLYHCFSGPTLGARGPTVAVVDASSVVNPRVFFDMEVGGQPAGRIEFELFARVTPKTAENFRALSTGEKGVSRSGTRLHYKGSLFHRILPDFVCQGGDLSMSNAHSGESIYGGTFEDEWEHGVIHHTEPALLSMANDGKNSNGSQFFITMAPASSLDGKHVVFGRVVSGMDVLRAIERVGSRDGTPSARVVVMDSGQLGNNRQPVQVVERFDL